MRPVFNCVDRIALAKGSPRLVRSAKQGVNHFLEGHGQWDGVGRVGRRRRRGTDRQRRRTGRPGAAARPTRRRHRRNGCACSQVQAGH